MIAPQATRSRMLEVLDSKKMPVLPVETPYLISSLSDETLNFNQLSKVIERFPTIAARLIALANSAWSAPISPIYSLEESCTRLGLSVVKSDSVNEHITQSYVGGFLMK